MHSKWHESMGWVFFLFTFRPLVLTVAVHSFALISAVRLCGLQTWALSCERFVLSCGQVFNSIALFFSLLLFVLFTCMFTVKI